MTAADRPTLARLREVAEAAMCNRPEVCASGGGCLRDGDFDATFDPPTVTALLDELESLRGVVAAVEATLTDLWRVTDCGCGHRADVHLQGYDSGCIGGLSLCPCRDSFATIVQRRLRAALDGAPSDGGRE